MESKHGTIKTVSVRKSERAMLRFTRTTKTCKKICRAFVLEPGDEEDAFEWGEFSLRGRFNVVEKINDPAKASKAFKAFKA